jgi:hypothetical protein
VLLRSRQGDAPLQLLHGRVSKQLDAELEKLGFDRGSGTVAAASASARHVSHEAIISPTRADMRIMIRFLKSHNKKMSGRVSAMLLPIL